MDALERQEKSSRTALKLCLALFTFLIIFMQFYGLLYKLPFEPSVSTKNVGFVHIFLYFLLHYFSLWPPLLWFLLVQISLQIILSLIVYWISWQISQFIGKTNNVLLIGILLWLTVQANIFVWNWYLYPHSFFSKWLNSLIAAKLQTGFYMVLLIVTTLIILSSVIIAIANLIKNKKIYSLASIALLIFLLLIFWYSPHLQWQQHKQQRSPKPNIILILTDSLRPDFYDHNKHNPNYPNLTAILKDSFYFTNAFTTLGRSTPGLMAILTGKYPKDNGARFNLINNKDINFSNSLNELLKKEGYQSILAADNLQFINVDDHYGFDKIISPATGIYNFIFTFANDFPLSNLLTNTFIGKYLFPYNYGNRPSYHTYIPGAFVQLLKDNLNSIDANKPLFMEIDLTITHWPYVWAKQAMLPNLPARYDDAVKTLDQQYGEIINLLKARGWLDHAILITLSDHGDSLGLPGDRVIQEKNYQGTKDRLSLITNYPYTVKKFNGQQQYIGFDTSVGHGTDLLSMTQLRTTLAFRFFGFPYQPKIISERVALIDIAPTLIDLLNLPTPPNIDGLSLKPLFFTNDSNAFATRPLFLESEIEIPLIDLTKNKQSTVQHLIDQYANLYTVDLNTFNLVLKPEAVKKLLSEKQRGIIHDDWLLVHFPGKNNTQSFIMEGENPELNQCYYYFATSSITPSSQKYICYKAMPTQPYYVLVNLKDNHWDIFFEGEQNKNPVFARLSEELKKFYVGELPSSALRAPSPTSGRRDF